MDEIEFARNVAGRLNEKTRESVLQSLQSLGFHIDGFRSMQKVPVKMLQASLKKPVGRGKQSTASVFLREVKNCTIDDPAIELVNLWFGSEEDKALAEKQIIIKPVEVENPQKSVITLNTDTKKNNAISKEVSIELEEQRKKNKQLQQKIQRLKKQLEDASNELKTEKKLNEKMSQEMNSLREDNNELVNKSIKYKEELDKYIKCNNDLNDKIMFIDNALRMRPKILCFTKEKISKEYIFMYNIEIHDDLSSLGKINWKKYNKIFVSESDFPMDKIQMISTLSGKHVDQARNISKIIERII